MKIVKTIGFIIGFTLLVYIVAFVGNFISTVLSNVLNLETLLGQIILLAIFATVFWNILFFGTIFLSTLIPNRLSAIVCLVWVVLINLRDLFQITHWTVGVMFVVDLIATVFPMIICISKFVSEEKEKKADDEKKLREELKAEIIEELRQKKD